MMGKLSYLPATLALALSNPAQAAEPPVGRWIVTRDTALLSGAPTIIASLPSTNTLSNAIGLPAEAYLTFRCADGRMSFYVNWPQVLAYNGGTNFLGQPKTIAVWRVDNGKSQGNLWDIDSSWTAAGEFKHKSATKLISSLLAANTLVVRLTGRLTQDAQFDLAGIGTIAPQVARTCGAKLDR